MRISVDTIYQRVLALANKEQRGYITPQEFNLFANLAQQEIFEQYFYDLNKVSMVPGNDTVFANVDDMLKEKLSIFEKIDSSDEGNTPSSYTAANDGVGLLLPSYIYRVSRVEFGGVECEMVPTKTWRDVISYRGTLLGASTSRPIVNIRDNIIKVEEGSDFESVPSAVYYFKKPQTVRWGYIVINKKALYNPASSISFNLHQSEESELVYKILKLAGVALQKQDVAQIGQGLDTNQQQQEKQ